MKWLDYRLQRERIKRVRPYLENGARVLDIGCADGALFRFYDQRLAGGVGIDMDPVPAGDGKYTYVQGMFPSSLPPGGEFDLVSALAVVEHIPESQHDGFAAACFGSLRSGGRVIVTVPSARVDTILQVLKAVRVVDGMADGQHYGFDPAKAIGMFERAGFELERHSHFQLGLNNLFVFRKPAEGRA